MALAKRRKRDDHDQELRHPLAEWLEEEDIGAIPFAAEVGLAHKTVYNTLQGDVLNPTADTLLAIESGTGGAVSVRKQLDWLKAMWAPK